jgi:hydrogenase-4 membrane subunit HyfE
MRDDSSIRNINIHVLPFGAVLLKSFAFSITALPEEKVITCSNQILKQALTLLDQVLLVILDRNTIFRQIPNRLVCNLPKFFGNLTDQA